MIRLALITGSFWDFGFLRLLDLPDTMFPRSYDWDEAPAVVSGEYERFRREWKTRSSTQAGWGAPALG